MRIAAVAVALATLTSVAAAPPGMTPVQDDEVPGNRGATIPAPPAGYYVYGPMAQPMAAPVIEGSMKSEGTATMLSLGTTAAGFALLAAAGKQDDGGGMGTLGVLALMIGPSAGHIYAGETGHAVGMSLVRGGAAVVFIAGVLKATMVYGASDCIDWCDSTNNRDDGATMMWVGGLSFVAATVYDIVDAPRAARRRNNKTRQWQVNPMMVGTSNAKTPGMGFAGRF
jgi:hypothetical protein